MSIKALVPIECRVPSGTAPFIIPLTSQVSINLNADLLDGFHASQFSLASHKLHPWADNEYASDAYNEDKSLRALTETCAGDQLRFANPTSVEYWDGAAWVAWVGWESVLKNAMSGSLGPVAPIDHVHRRFRITWNRAVAYPTRVLVAMETDYSAITWPGSVTITTETNDGSAWGVRDFASFGSPNTVANWGLHIKATAELALHNGHIPTRITVDISDWVDSGAYTTFPLSRLMLLHTHNARIRPSTPYSWDHSKKVTFEVNPSAPGFTSTVATGTAPLVVASTSQVANLNSSLLQGRDWAGLTTSILKGSGDYMAGGIYFSSGSWRYQGISGTRGFYIRHGDAAGGGANNGGQFQIGVSAAASTGVNDVVPLIRQFLFDASGTLTIPAPGGTSPFFISSTTEVTSLNAQFHGGTRRDTLVASLRSNVILTGGGDITVSGSSEVAWSQRMIVMGNGRGGWFSTTGFFDIVTPPNGTVVQGVGGHPGATATSSGVPMAAFGGWEALYYALPLGGTNNPQSNNFRLAYYGTDFEAPEHWVLIAVRNNDNGYIRFGVGITLRAGQAYSQSTHSSAKVPDTFLFAGNNDTFYLTRSNHIGTQAWSTIVSTPTTLAGYGITDALFSAGCAHRLWESGSIEDGLLPGTAFGSVLDTRDQGHFVIGLRGNDNEDSFAVVTRKNLTSNYDHLAFRVTNDGRVLVGSNQVWHAGNFDPTLKSNVGHTHDATEIVSGILPSGRLVGAYGNVTAVGTLIGLTVDGATATRGSAATSAPYFAVWEANPTTGAVQVKSRTLAQVISDVGAGLGDAPSDGSTYGRFNASWVTVLRTSGGVITGTLGLTGIGSDISTSGSYRFLMRDPGDNLVKPMTAAFARSHIDAAASSHTHGYTDVQSVPTARLLGRTTAGTGATEPIQASSDFSLSALVLGLSTTGVSAGAYGASGASIPVLGIDNKGRVTSASNRSLTPSDIGAVPTSRQITGVNSVSGGGSLTLDRTLELVNDQASPGNSKYYGTNPSGTKGFHDLPSPGTGWGSLGSYAIIEMTSDENGSTKTIGSGLAWVSKHGNVNSTEFGVITSGEYYLDIVLSGSSLGSASVQISAFYAGDPGPSPKHCLNNIYLSEVSHPTSNEFKLKFRIIEPAGFKAHQFNFLLISPT